MPIISRNDYTFALIKCGAVARGDAGKIVSEILDLQFRVARMQMETLSQELAARIYAEHWGMPYYASLIQSVTSCVTVQMVLQGPNVIHQWRELIGPSDPAARKRYHLRYKYGSSVPGEGADNALHGSDSVKSAGREIGLVFPGLMTGEAAREAACDEFQISLPVRGDQVHV